MTNGTNTTYITMDKTTTSYFTTHPRNSAFEGFLIKSGIAGFGKGLCL